jgi:hypothetical protein
MIHYFNRNIAKTYGIKAAILLQYISHNQDIRRDDKGFYKTIKGFQEACPYLSAYQIKSTLAKLRAGGVLKANAHNKHKYDRTIWYTFADPGVQIEATNSPRIYFNAEIASIYGIEEAILYQNLVYWKKKNKQDWHKTNCVKLAEVLPIPVRTIQAKLNKLSTGDKALLTAVHGGQCGRDKLYAIGSNLRFQTQEPTMEAQEPPMDTQKLTNGNAKSNQPIPLIDNIERKAFEETTTKSGGGFNTSSPDALDNANQFIEHIKEFKSDWPAKIIYSDKDTKNVVSFFRDNPHLTAEEVSNQFHFKNQERYRLIKEEETTRNQVKLNCGGDRELLTHQLYLLDNKDSFDPVFYLRKCNDVNWFLNYYERI